MTKKLFILREITDFASGAFENTAVENGGIQLGRKASGHLLAGSYTTPPLSSAPFGEMVPSWNADTPPGTHVEVEARVAAAGQWSQWFSFGAWSPFLLRASPEAQQDAMARCDAEYLRVQPDSPLAELVQLRVNLRSEDPALSPTVRLLAVSVNSDAEHLEGPGEFSRVLEVPAYSCLVRDPSISAWIGSATSLAMLMNRHGEDVLPEEVARAVYDAGAGRYSNLSFLTAAGGMYGYECYAGYAGVDAVRREVWRGNPVGVMVRYRAPALSGQEADSALPVLEGATVDSAGHIAVVRGIETLNGETTVYMCDPFSPDDEAVRREISLSQFEEIYMGLCLILRAGARGAGSAKPRRQLAQMDLSQGEIRLMLGGRLMVPGPFTREEYARSTLCYTVSGPVLYASAAQRKFYYPAPDEDGALPFDVSGIKNRRMIFYRVGPLGTTAVGEKTVPPGPDE